MCQYISHFGLHFWPIGARNAARTVEYMQPYVFIMYFTSCIGIAWDHSSLEFAWNWILYPQLLFSRIKSKFDAMNVFTSFIFAATISLVSNFYVPMQKISWGFAQLIFHGENKSWEINLFSTTKIKVVKTFMASNLLFILENK